MSDRRTENARTLATMLGISSDEAAPLLDTVVAVTVDNADQRARRLAIHLKDILSRTLSTVTVNEGYNVAAAEIIVGAAPAHHGQSIRVQITAEEIQIGETKSGQLIEASTHPVILIIAACYAAGVALRIVLPGLVAAASPVDPGLVIPITSILGPDVGWLFRQAVLEDTYLAGAGAIGNGFLYALAALQVSGTVVIVDPDFVSDGNLNRCIWFSEADTGREKAVRLAEIAGPHFGHLALKPQVLTLQDLGKRQSSDTWLRRLVVGVDSRRTRRRLQTELPREVFDASTTDITEIVLHHHVQPTDSACLACIYHETPDELVREKHMAEVLGVDHPDIQQHFVSAEAARRIHARYPHVPIEQIQNQAYDSLFKALCGEGRLVSGANRQVLAPFGFVSVLAGAYLAIEVCRRTVLGPTAHDFNYWRVSPWAPPVTDLKQVRARNPLCEFCGHPILTRVCREVWKG